MVSSEEEKKAINVRNIKPLSTKRDSLFDRVKLTLSSLVPLWLFRRKEMSSELPQVHSFLFHPALTWFDVIIGMVLPWILPLSNVIHFPPTRDSKRALECNNTLREALTKSVRPAISAEVSAYTKATGMEMAETTLNIPRQLDRWKGLALNGTEFPNKELAIVLFYPKCLLPDEKQANATIKNDRGFVEVEMIDVKSVPDDVPLIVHFHGGGLTLGSPYDDMEGFKLFSALLKAEQQSTKTPAKAIFASVEYSLAPEYPFPAAPIDALTAVVHFIESNPKRQLHLAGVSAGGYLAAIATMECQELYPNHILSSSSLSPMMNPVADTMSMYQNAPGAKICPTPWIRWCWQAYLEMPPPAKEEEGNGNDADDNELNAVLGRASNRIGWEQCKWNGSEWERWIRPELHLPKQLSTTKTRFLVSANRGDVLYSEAVEYMKRLGDAGVTNLRWFDHGGLHFIGTFMNSENFNEVVEAWRDVIFGHVRQ